MERFENENELLSEYMNLLGKMLDKKCAFYTDLVDKYRKDRMQNEEVCMMLVDNTRKAMKEELIERSASFMGKTTEEMKKLIGNEVSTNCRNLLRAIGAPASLKDLTMSKNGACQFAKAAKEDPEGFRRQFSRE